MNSAQIDYSLRRDPCTSDMWRGVFPLDYLKTAARASMTLPAGYIVNTAPSTHDGKHWVAFYFTEGGAEYFDSYGFKPTKPELLKFLKVHGHSRWTMNSQRLQGSLSTVCGQHCIFYLTLRARGWSAKEIGEQFGQERDWNDGMVKAFVNKHFNLNTKEIDYEFIIQTVCPLEA
jgi:hypothetical protein